MTIGEQNNKNIMGLMDQIQGIPVKPYDDSPSAFECEQCGKLHTDDGEILCPKCRDDYSARSMAHEEREVDEDLLFEQARELKLEKGE